MQETDQSGWGFVLEGKWFFPIRSVWPYHLLILKLVNRHHLSVFDERELQTEDNGS